MTDQVLVIGSGGREHALAWKLSKSPSIKHIFVAPGNAGTHLENSSKISNCSLNVKNHGEIIEWCKKNYIKLVAVGPEDPLANGLADDLHAAGIKCFGPCQTGAQIEASKAFAKSFMDRHEIPTARWKSFDNPEDAKNHILSAPYDALVVKASGLAAGKGVIVGKSKGDAVNAVNQLRQDKGLLKASETIVIEELLQGEEVSILCFTDGVHVALMPPSQDHKRLNENDEGPNTGGMGAYCRCPQVSVDDIKYIEKNIMQKAVSGLKKEGITYVGVLYAGLMMTKEEPKVLEFNCRFGDPETQVILPLLQTDLYDIMKSCVNGTLNDMTIQWSDNFAAGVVLVSGGYPGTYPKGKIISGLDKVSDKNIIFHAGTAVSSEGVVTSGGRVLAAVAVEQDLQIAVTNSLQACEIINFDGKFYRKDIAHKALKRQQNEGMTYKSSGVDIESGEAFVNRIKSLVKQTVRPEVCGGLGGFGGIFDLAKSDYIDPYLVSTCGGIGEKQKVAQECGMHELVGHDLVANTVNEILCHGAEPLFFLDTYTCGKLDIAIATEVVTGITKACQEANCALIGGETAEMPGMYVDGDYDMTAFCRGAVAKGCYLPLKEKISLGDAVIGITTTSINTKAYSVLRKVMKKEGLVYTDKAPFDSKQTVKDVVTMKNKIYVKSVHPLIKKKYIKAAAYCNKEGLQSIQNMIPPGVKVVLDATKWTIPSVFQWIATSGNFSDKSMFQNFNCGLDMVLIVQDDLKHFILEKLKASGETASLVGYVDTQKKSEAKLEIINADFSVKKSKPVVKVAVLASDKGTNLLALIDYTQNVNSVSSAVISLVISDAEGNCSKIAKNSNISLKIFKTSDYNSAEVMDTAIHETLKRHEIDIVCIDGFSHVFSKNFIASWHGKILNIHPSILPAFECTDVYRETLDIGARITGCSVYFLDPEGNTGAIIEQSAIYIDIDDTVETLREKEKCLQNYVYPKALDLVARKQVYYGPDSKLIRLENDECESFYLDSNSCDDPELQEKINFLLKSTARPGYINNAVNACGIFDLAASGYQKPYLVSGTDGVGTKLKIAQICNKHDTIGIDLVAMCVNDILTHGAEPLIFMQSFNCGKLNRNVVLDVISGIAEGCKQSNCALISSEVSQLPDIYLNKSQCILDFENYDVVGYAEGAVVKGSLLPRLEEIKENDIVIGLPSSGIHSNGYSLIRKLVHVKKLRYKDKAPFSSSQTLGEALLTPTKIYVQSLLPLIKKGYVKAAAHITGGGLTENIPRILPEKFGVKVDASKWDVPSVFKWISEEGCLSEKEMLRTFNCGIGMVLIVDKAHESIVLKSLSDEKASCIGSIKHFTEGEERVEVRNFNVSKHSTCKSKKKVGVLISGSGTNLQALIDYTQNPSNRSNAEIVLVLSNVPGVEGLKRAERANIPTKVLSHKAFKSRVEFDMAVHSILKNAGVEIVCLAGFMRILSKEFVELWQGRLLNVHPALLPAFKGMNAHKQVLERGARITGCTVHFVEPAVDAGAIIEQAAVRVDINDTEKSLQEKVKVLEHKIFPSALELLASGKISRGTDGKIIWHY